MGVLYQYLAARSHLLQQILGHVVYRDYAEIVFEIHGQETHWDVDGFLDVVYYFGACN